MGLMDNLRKKANDFGKEFARLNTDHSCCDEGQEDKTDKKSE